MFAYVGTIAVMVPLLAAATYFMYRRRKAATVHAPPQTYEANGRDKPDVVLPPNAPPYDRGHWHTGGDINEGEHLPLGTPAPAFCLGATIAPHARQTLPPLQAVSANAIADHCRALRRA